MKSVVLTLLEISFYASIIMLVVLFIRQILNKFPKRVIVYLWIIVLIRLSIPFTISANFGIVPSFDSEKQAIENRINDFGIDVNLPGIGRFSYPGITDLSKQKTKTYDTFKGIFLVWSIGAIIGLTTLFTEYLRMWKIANRALYLRNNIYISYESTESFVFGIIKPKIIISGNISEPYMKYVMMHEQRHISYMDNVIKLYGSILLCIYWFNPLIYIAFILLSNDIEYACDEKVAMNLNKTDLIGYIKSLIFAGAPSNSISHFPGFKGNLKKRVIHLTEFKKPKTFIFIISVLIIIMASFLMVSQKSTENTFSQPDEIIIESKFPSVYSTNIEEIY